MSMTKSTFWRCPEIRTYNLPSHFLPIPENTDDGIVLLGAPIGSQAFTQSKIHDKVKEIEGVLSKLGFLHDSQVELSLLRSCFGIAKFGFLMRACDPAANANAFASFDDLQCKALSHLIVASISTSDPRWILASLPVSLGGVGLRSAALHSLAAFVASILQCSPLVDKLVRHDSSRIDTSKPYRSFPTLPHTPPHPFQGLSIVTPPNVSCRVAWMSRDSLF